MPVTNNPVGSQLARGFDPSTRRVRSNSENTVQLLFLHVHFMMTLFDQVTISTSDGIELYSHGASVNRQSKAYLHVYMRL